MNKEIIETIKNVKTSDELKDVATKNGYKLTDEEVENYFQLYHNNGPVDEEELDNVTGGSSCIGGNSYSDDKEGWLIVTTLNSCYGKHDMATPIIPKGHCGSCVHSLQEGLILYCTVRSRYDDPYNDSIGTKRKVGTDGKYWKIDGSEW